MKQPQINSLGPPPERYADRLVDEMTRWLIEKRAHVWPEVKKTPTNTSGAGNPKAQARLVAGRTLGSAAASRLLCITGSAGIPRLMK